MDEMVKAALRKWPNVPACRDWLGLDGRGDWYMRDDAVQRAGPFPTVKGSRIEHRMLREFIGRNYEADDQGCWFFQNGPQRVYVELELTPWVWRLDAEGLLAGEPPRIESHTGRAASFVAAWLDEHDRLYLQTDLGLGLVHSLDMACAAEAVESGRWMPEVLPVDEMPARFGFRRSPAQAGLRGSGALT